MSALSTPFPWGDFVWFVAQLVGMVVAPIILLIIAITAGIWLASATGRLTPNRAKLLRRVTVTAIVVLPPAIVMLVAQSSTAIPIAILALAGSICFAVTLIATERETFRTQTSWWIK